MKIKNIMKRGFTLIELIIVIAIIAILASAIFVAVDPARRLHESRNAKRWSDVTTLVEGVVKYQTDNEGDHYTELQGLTGTQYYMIGTCVSGASGECTDQAVTSVCVDLTDIGANYLGAIPKDPRTGTDAMTDYYINISPEDTVTIGACEAEGEGPGGAEDAPDIELVR